MVFRKGIYRSAMHAFHVRIFSVCSASQIYSLVVGLYHCSAWEVLSHQEVNIEKLAKAFPDTFGVMLQEPALVKRLEIEGA